MADDEKTRWAIDVMTAWAHDNGGEFVHERIDAYLAESRGGPDSLITGLINLSGLLLMGLEATTGKSSGQILQAIAATLARNGDR
ncbi:hypothetical protein [Mycolicibacterium sp.]|uniref:hypothetical protein n=1 Tax=Mycolicibacterium sp. TaxID=2320850 RepID=UPI003D0B8135